MFAQFFQEVTLKFTEADRKGYYLLISEFEARLKEKSNTQDDFKREGLGASFILASLLGGEAVDRKRFEIFIHLLLLMPRSSLQACVDGLVLQKHRDFLKGYVKSIIGTNEKLLDNIRSLEAMLS